MRFEYRPGHCRVIERKEHESPQEYKGRQFWAEWRRGVDQYEIEVVPGVIRCPGGAQFKAEFHRIVVYRQPNRFRATRPKAVCEVKVKNIFAAPLANGWSDAPWSRCHVRSTAVLFLPKG